MRDSKDLQADTRERVLHSAVDVFAEKGFRDATIHEICEGAGANIAAVNYYFRSKENLYTEAWRKAFHDSLEAHPPDGGVPENAPAEERLRGRLAALIRRVSDEEVKEFLIVHKEMANPTGLLQRVVHECLEPLQKQMVALMRELLGPAASDRQVRFCMMSLMSQCMEPVMRERMHRSLPGGVPHPPPLIDDIEAFIDHVVTFCLGGIRAVREEIEKGGADE